MNPTGRYRSTDEYPQRTPSHAELTRVGGMVTTLRTAEPQTDDERKNGPPVKKLTPRINGDALGPADVSGWPWKGSR